MIHSVHLVRPLSTTHVTMGKHDAIGMWAGEQTDMSLLLIVHSQRFHCVYNMFTLIHNSYNTQYNSCIHCITIVTPLRGKTLGHTTCVICPYYVYDWLYY